MTSVQGGVHNGNGLAGGTEGGIKKRFIECRMQNYPISLFFHLSGSYLIQKWLSTNCRCLVSSVSLSPEVFQLGAIIG